MRYEYKTKGTCSQTIIFEIEDEKIKNVQFIGGCNGNLQGISKLVEGMNVDEVISRIEAVCTELQSLGFREVVLDNYLFPTSQNIVYDESERTKSMILGDTINTLQNDLNAMGLLVSTSFSSDSVSVNTFSRENPSSPVCF